MAYFDRGDIATIDGDFYKNDGVTPTDPDELVLLIREPDGTVIQVAMNDITKIDTGIYQYGFPTVHSGRHFYRWVVSGENVNGVAEKSFVVKRSAFNE